jgi:hypothetical protein
MAHVPSHHDHQVGEWIGIRAQVDHVVTFRARPRLTRRPGAAPKQSHFRSGVQLSPCCAL